MARALLRARAARTPLDVTLTSGGAFTMDDAYAVQRELTALRLAEGARIVGWKLGYTSVAMREQMGVDEPNVGPLLDTMALSSPGVVPAQAIQPRVEPEIALRLARDLEPGCTVDDVLAACDGAFACLEVVDSIWAGYRFGIEDNTADGSSAAWFVVGDQLPWNGWDEGDGLAQVAVRLLVDGAPVADATGAAAGGHPASGVVWLADQVMRRYGTALTAGSLILTGGLTAAVPLRAGSRISAEFTGAAVTADPGTITGLPGKATFARATATLSPPHQ